MTNILILNNDGIDGLNGDSGFSGAHGTSYGQSGGDGSGGSNGQPGTDAGAIGLKLTTVNSNIVIQYDLGPRPFFPGIKGENHLDLGNPDSEIQLSSKGGNGGHGGNGGRGGDGAAGYPGMNATQSSVGTNGGPGGNGGRGGDGGNGANSGSGNNIFIKVSQLDMDLLMTLKQKISNTDCGVPGDGGNGGNGGSGGPGGMGGLGYTWTESYQTRDSNGNWNTQYVQRSNPGGYDGPYGAGGIGGNGGLAGNFGKKGLYKIFLENEKLGMVNEYSGPYNLKVSNTKIMDTIGYGIVEPESDVNLTVTYHNCGGMPTPSHQDILGYIRDNEWVYCDQKNKVPLKRWIPENESSTLENPIRFHVKDIIHSSLPREPFVETSTMDHECLTTRVNQTFRSVSETHTPFNIEYPIKSSLIKGVSCITFGEEAPIVFSLWNKSQLGIGKHIQDQLVNSPTRILFTRFKVHLHTQGGTKHIQSSDFIIRDSNGKILEGNNFIAHVPAIGPSSLKFLTSTFQFDNPDIKPYTRVFVESTLYLGHIRNMLAAQPIQARPFEIQLSEGYNPLDTNSDFLLITNNRSEYEEVQAWSSFASSIGSSVNVWNLNLYNDFNLYHVKSDGKSLMQDFRCKNIIFLNNQFVYDEHLNNSSIVIRPRQLLAAAQYHGIHTLVVGSAFDIRNELIPIMDYSTPSYYSSSRHFKESLTKRIPFGIGNFQPVPAFYTTGIDWVGYKGKVHVNKKERCVTLHHLNHSLLVYKSKRDVYPERSVYMNQFVIENESEESFTLKLPNLDQSLLFSGKNAKLLLESIRSMTLPSNLHLNSQDLQLSAIEGNLRVRNGDSGSYSKKYFVFNSLHRTLIQYNDNSKSASSKKIIDLSRFSVTKRDPFGTEKDEHNVTFQIVTNDKVWYFKANTVEQFKEWTDRLSEFNSMEYIHSRSDPSASIKDSVILNQDSSPNQKQIAESRHYSVISFKKQFIFGKPAEADLVKEAEKLSKELNSRFPNQRNIIVYDYKPFKLSKFQFSIGNIEIHRSLDKTTPHLVQLQLDSDEEIHKPSTIQSPSTVYGLLKSLDFRSKLKVLDRKNKFYGDGNEIKKTHSIGNGIVEMLVMAIVSDICEEQYHFRDSSKWRDGLYVKQIKNSLVNLNILKRFEFQSLKEKQQTPFERLSSTLIGDVLIEIQMHLQIMKEVFHTSSDTLLFRRRGTDVDNAIDSIWKKVLAVHINGAPLKNDKLSGKGSLNSKESKHIQKRIKEKKLDWIQFCVDNQPNWGYRKEKPNKKKITKNKVQIIQGYRTPCFSHSIVDSTVKIEDIMSKSEFTRKYLPSRPDFTAEQSTHFDNHEDHEARSNMLSNIQIQQLGCKPEENKSSRLVLEPELINNSNDTIPY
eukprot:gene3740-4659_t